MAEVFKVFESNPLKVNIKRKFSVSLASESVSYENVFTISRFPKIRWPL